MGERDCPFIRIITRLTRYSSSVFAEHLYTKPDVFLKIYAPRGAYYTWIYYHNLMRDLAAQGEHVPPVPRHNSEELLLVNGRPSREGQVQVPNHLPAVAMPSAQGRPLRPLKRSYAMLGES
jgi:Ser/Thr protein kinase RdoA (MazF antagonist)